jgi:hypothetical protein
LEGRIVTRHYVAEWIETDSVTISGTNNNTITIPITIRHPAKYIIGVSVYSRGPHYGQYREYDDQKLYETFYTNDRVVLVTEEERHYTVTKDDQGKEKRRLYRTNLNIKQVDTFTGKIEKE